MKNKILIVMSTVFLILIIVSVTACNGQSVDASNYNDDYYKNMFTKVYSDIDFYVVYDNETKVMYAVSDGHNNYGNFTLLVNADGTPKLYDGE